MDAPTEQLMFSSGLAQLISRGNVAMIFCWWQRWNYCCCLCWMLTLIRKLHASATSSYFGPVGNIECSLHVKVYLRSALSAFLIFDQRSGSLSSRICFESQVRRCAVYRFMTWCWDSGNGGRILAEASHDYQASVGGCSCLPLRLCEAATLLESNQPRWRGYCLHR